ncbi:MAG: SDR family oxidoreductase [Oscillospiraceae bacterium]|nr:SDR family oxidoreductase [Oscillospiraceae bacterium]
MEQSTGLLAGKYCVITSGAHGMGFGIARLFAEQGGIVAVCGRSETGAASGETLAAISPGSFFFRCDMGEPAQTEAFAEEVLRRFGRVDVLVNNVGINKKDKIVDIDIEDFNRIYQVNLISTILLLKKFIPNMLDNSIRGSVIHISSMNAIAPAPTTGTYSSSKGAVISLSRVLASEVGKYGIRSNVICPGWVATTYIEEDLRQALREGRSAYDVLDGYDGTSPLLAPGRMSDVANLALFLASDRSSYITGAAIRADGAAVMQAHACSFPRPEQEPAMKQRYYDSILREYGI